MPVDALHPAGANVRTVLYSLWWMAMPATITGDIDRVFTRSFAYDSGGGIVYGLIKKVFTKQTLLPIG